MDDIILTPEYVKDSIKATRHNKELMIYIIISFFGSIVLKSCLSTTFGNNIIVQYFEDILYELLWLFDSELFVIFTALFSLFFFSGIFTLLFILLRNVIELYRYYAGQMSYAVRVSENNFPKIYEKVKEYTYLLGLKKEPEVYVMQMNGALNAYSCWVFGKTFIQLNAEVVDLAYMENKDLDTVAFILAHEFGHIYLHHVQLFYNILPIFANLFPILGNILYLMLSRAREYSCDRVAQSLTNHKNQKECMMLLGVGRHAYKYMDVENYLEEISANHNKVELMFRWFINFFSTHPIMPFRTKAILDSNKKSGRLL